MEYRDITVLMSACGSPSIPGMIRCLKENGERNIRVIGIDMDDDPTTQYLVDAFSRLQISKTTSQYLLSDTLGTL